MKTFWKIVAALITIAGIVYVIATYGDKIVAWAKALVSKCHCICDEGCCCGEDCCCDEDCSCDEDCCEEADFEG